MDMTQQPIKMKLGTHIPFNEHTTIITVNIVVNNVVLVKGVREGREGLGS